MALQQVCSYIAEGLDIHRQKYGKDSYYSSPDILVFESRIADGDKIDNRTATSGSYLYKWKATWWHNQLNFCEKRGRFFSLSLDKQLRIVLEFARSSYEQAKIEEADA